LTAPLLAFQTAAVLIWGGKSPLYIPPTPKPFRQTTPTQTGFRRPLAFQLRFPESRQSNVEIPAILRLPFSRRPTDIQNPPTATAFLALAASIVSIMDRVSIKRRIGFPT
jgi:hypothetical protein